MAALTYAPQGLQVVRHRLGLMPNLAANNRYFIQQGYATAIAFGDLVYTQTSGGGQGYIAPYAAAGGGGTSVLGVFLGCQPYYDTVQKGTVNKNYWAGTESASGDVQCFISDDPFTVYLAQINGGPITIASRGQNCDLLGCGSPNSQGLSVAYLSGVATTSTLPLRIIDWSETATFQYDPTVATSANQPTNNYALVTLNPGACEMLQGTGV